MTVYAVFKTRWNPDSNYDETILIDIYSNEQTAMQECINYNSCHDNSESFLFYESYTVKED